MTSFSPLPEPRRPTVPAGGWFTGTEEDWHTASGPPVPAQSGTAARGPVRDGDEAWAMLCYLGVPFVSVLAPLAVLVLRARSSGYVRQHVTQALNLAITIALYNLCAVIAAGMLALVAVGVALAVAGSAALALWLVALAYLMRAAAQASLGEYYQLPRWICATIAR